MNADFNLVKVSDYFGCGKDRNFDFNGVQFLQTQGLKSRIIRGGRNGAVNDRLIEREERDNIANASTQMLAPMQRHEHAALFQKLRWGGDFRRLITGLQEFLDCFPRKFEKVGFVRLTELEHGAFFSSG